MEMLRLEADECSEVVWKRISMDMYIYIYKIL